MKTGLTKCRLMASALASTTALISAAANANSTEMLETEAAPADEAPEIVVSASKRDTTLQEATLSVSVVTAKTLKEANITEVTGLNGIVPGLVVARSGGGERLISIRGVGSETPQNANTQPGVSLHIDGVYIFNSIAANAAFIDVAQVEVLRGPQGTTFGQGSTGGTINIVSNQPSTAGFAGGASLGVGNYGLTQGTAAVNVPAGNFAIRGAVQFNKRDGYAFATDVPGFSEYELDDQNEIGWKLAAIWEPTDNLSVLLSTIQYESDTNGPAQKNILDPEPDPRILTQDYPGQSIIETELYYGVIKYDAGPFIAKSITGYQKLFSLQSWDGDGLTGDLFERNVLGGFRPAIGEQPERLGARFDHVPSWQQNTESWSQEINLASTGDGPFSWIVGGVYLWSKNSQYIVEFRSRTVDPLTPALPVDTPFDSPLVGQIAYAELSEITRDAYAGYFEASYDLSDKLTLTGGLRYNHDEYSGFADTNSSGPVITSGPYLQPRAIPGLTTNEWTGKAAIEYRLTPDNMVYLSYTRGFKPGGLNGSAAGAAPQVLGFENGIRPTYEPEIVNSIELGSKNTFAGGIGTFNASAFYYDYKNMQFLDEDAILFGEGIANAPSAEIYGLELEAALRPDDHWSFVGTLSLTEGKFNEDFLALDPAAAVLAQNAAGFFGTGEFFANFFLASLARDSARANINGNSVPKIPDIQGSATVGYTDTLGNGTLSTKATLIYRGEYQYRLFNNNAFDTTPSYAQVNLFTEYQPTDSPLTFSLTVTNLFDKAGINSRFSDPYLSAQTFDTFIPPRQVIGTISYTF